MKQAMIRNGSLLAIALLLVGCAGMRIPGMPEGEPEERQSIQLIGYAQRVATMTAEEQRQEYDASSQAFAKDQDPMNRMRLALLLATPGASIHDVARAASLLEPMAAAGDAASPLRSLARLIYVQLVERVAEQKRANQMREQIEGRKDVERGMRELREQLEGRKDAERHMREQLEARKEVERTLREQLEALKEIERTIIQRGQERQPRRK